MNEFFQGSILSLFLFKIKLTLHTVKIVTINSVKKNRSSCICISSIQTASLSSFLKDASTNVIHNHLDLRVCKRDPLSFFPSAPKDVLEMSSCLMCHYSPSRKPKISDNTTLPFTLVFFLSSKHWFFLMILDSILFYFLSCSYGKIFSLIGLISKSPKMSFCFVLLPAQIHPAHKSQSQREVFRIWGEVGMAGFYHSNIFSLDYAHILVSDFCHSLPAPFFFKLRISSKIYLRMTNFLWPYCEIKIGNEQLSLKWTDSGGRNMSQFQRHRNCH